MYLIEEGTLSTVSHSTDANTVSDSFDQNPTQPDASQTDAYSTTWTMPTTSSSVDSSAAKRTAGLFLLTFKEKFKLSQKAINFAVGSINTIVDSVCDTVQQSVVSDLREKGFCGDVMESFHHDDPFALLQTEYRQQQFFREEFGLVVSVLPF